MKPQFLNIGTKHLILTLTLTLVLVLGSTPLAVAQDATSDNDDANTETGAEADVVRIGVLGILADATIFVAEARGYFDQFNLDVELVQFQSGANAIPALATGDLDIAISGYSAGLFNAIGRGIELKIISGGAQLTEQSASGIFVSNAFYEEMQANPDAGLALLKDRTIAINGEGNVVQVYFHWALQDVGLTLDDVRVELLPFADQLAALENGAIAAGFFGDPLAGIAEENGLAVTARPIIDIYGGSHDGSVIVASSQFLENRRDVATRALAAIMLASRDVRRTFILREQPIRDEILSTLMDYLPALRDEETLEHNFTSGFAPNGEIERSSLQRFLDAFYELGLIEVEAIDIEATIDSTIAQDALALIGEWEDPVETAGEAETIETTPETEGA